MGGHEFFERKMSLLAPTEDGEEMKPYAGGMHVGGGAGAAGTSASGCPLGLNVVLYNMVLSLKNMK